MTLEEQFVEIWALLQLEQARAAYLIDWGTEALAAGDDSPGLRRLAGAYAHEPLRDVLPWWQRAVRELKLTPPELGVHFRPYTRLLCQMVLRGERPSLDILQRLAQLQYQLPETDPLLYFFVELQDGLELLALDPQEAYAVYPELRGQPPEQLIAQECELFLAMSQVPELPAEMFTGMLCLRCGQISRPAYLPVKQSLKGHLLTLWKSGGKAFQAVCPACESNELEPFYSPQARWQWLTQQGFPAPDQPRSAH